MNTDNPFTAAERLESLKVAVVGGITAGFLSLVLLFIHRGAIADPHLFATLFTLNLATLTLLVHVAIGSLSGALFALVYRYAIRTDQNPQLNMGVVLAFTLVRGLALVDVGSAIGQHFLPFFLACGESFILFGLTSLILTFAMQRQWLKPFLGNITP